MTIPRYGFGSGGIFPARSARSILIRFGRLSNCPAPVGILNVIIASVCAILPGSGALRKHPHSPPRFRLWGHFSIHKPMRMGYGGGLSAISRFESGKRPREGDGRVAYVQLVTAGRGPHKPPSGGLPCALRKAHGPNRRDPGFPGSPPECGDTQSNDGKAQVIIRDCGLT